MSQKTIELIDSFVHAANQSGLQPRLCDEVPAQLRKSDSNEDGFCEWQIREVAATPWLTAIHSRLPEPLPDSFLSLITRYVFLDFEVGPIHLFANTGLEIWEEFTFSIFRDKALTETLFPAGFIHFARVPGGASYDPICFDTNVKTKAREWPIVQIDHEEILCRSRLRVVGRLKDSFRALIEDVVNRKPGKADPSLRSG
jgi:hypothetical protein